jgi:hypothetical protein
MSGVLTLTGLALLAVVSVVVVAVVPVAVVVALVVRARRRAVLLRRLLPELVAAELPTAPMTRPQRQARVPVTSWITAQTAYPPPFVSATGPTSELPVAVARSARGA